MIGKNLTSNISFDEMIYSITLRPKFLNKKSKIEVFLWDF